MKRRTWFAGLGSTIWHCLQSFGLIFDGQPLLNRLGHYLWDCTPIRCVTCGLWFMRGDFWNPWGPGRGPGLACSMRCCWEANPQGKTFAAFEAEFP